ncbi:MAG: TolC family protein [Myxococcota bacterium]
MLARLFTGFALFLSLGASATELTLDDAVQAALTNSRQIKIAGIGSTLARTSIWRDVAMMSPQLALGWGLTQYDSAFKNDIPGMGSIVIRPEQLSAGYIQATQPLTPLVGLIQKIRADYSSSQAAALTHEKARVDIAFAAATTYRLVQQLAAFNQIAIERVKLSDRRDEETSAIFEAGRLSETDLLRVRMRSGEAKVAAANLKAQYESTLAQLQNLLGMDLEDSIEMPPIPGMSQDNATFVVPKLPELDGSQTTEPSNLQRLDIRIARYQQEASSRTNVLSMASFLPVLNAFGRFDKNFADAGAFVPPQYYSFGLTLTWNVWDGGARFIDMRASSLMLAKANLEMVETSRLAIIDQRKKALEFQAAKEALAVQKITIEQANQAYEGNNERFKLGGITVTDLLQSELEMNNAKMSWAEALINVDIKHMALEQAEGAKRPTSIL